MIRSRLVDEYIASQPEATRGVLRRVRRAISEALPRAQESISYRIPAYKLNGQTIVQFAAWKDHYSIYPANERVRAAFKDELGPLEVRKSTLRLSFGEPVPVKLIGRIAKFLAKESGRLR